jgi:hypothetical protein
VTIDGRDHLIISKGEAVTSAEGKVQLYYSVSEDEGKVRPSFRVYPDIDKAPLGFDKVSQAAPTGGFLTGDAFAVYEGKNILLNDKKASFEKVDDSRYRITLPGSLDGLSEIFTNISYEGNTASLYKDGELVSDNFYTGQDFEIGLKRFFDVYGEGKEISFDLVIEPLMEDDAIYLQNWPVMQDGKAEKLLGVHLTAVHIIDIS